MSLLLTQVNNRSIVYSMPELNTRQMQIALMVAKAERLAQLVFLDEFIDEVNRAYAFHALSSNFLMTKIIHL